ncbi:MAG TPA: peptidase S10 [Stellaceae bacterium]|nr:peptidase S10 [Stellaceae bacterium]
MFGKRYASIFAAVALAAGLAAMAQAQVGAPTSSPRPAASSHPSEHPRTAVSRRLPADSVTKHSVTLPGRTLNFKAMAGTIMLRNASTGDDVAEVAYIAYQLDGADVAKRPVTFVFNGGPGAGSAWLQLGALGPWRLPLTQGTIAPSASPALVANDDTWLDFTDLVFVDPPGTGYSEIVGGEEARKNLYSVRGDIDALAVVIRRWLADNERLPSPKFIVGESYGGYRGPRLAQVLATDQGVGISGLVLISPALDMSGRSADDPLTWAIRLPSFAAVAREHNGPVTRAQLADAERYASGDYLLDFLRGPRDTAAVARMVDRVSALTGLDPALVRRMHGRIDKGTFLREFDRAHGKVGAYYDATITAYDPSPESKYDLWLDPVAEGFDPPMASAMMDLYARRLGWKIDARYEMLNKDVGRAWDWGHDHNALNAIPALKRMLALDPNFRVLVVQGLTDLQVPYFGTELLLDQIPDYGAPGRVAFKVYGGGHMLYTRDASRKAMRDDALRLIEGK